MSTNLTSIASSFVGRESDLGALAERLDEGRLVTVLGPGGIGKTRLAQRFAEARAATFTEHDGGGVWFCDLTDAEQADDVVAVVASALGIDLAGHEGSLPDALGRAIARRGPTLIVLDNFDRLTRHALATVGRWLALAASARFLVTSRAPLDLVGEQLWSLSPLPPAAALELFGRRARQVQPSFELAAEHDTVVAIVEAIDRLPLAIELAATRLGVLSATQLRDRLARPLDLLEGRELGRHASMRRTILESVELLDSAQHRLFVACAQLRNGFTLETVEAVLGDLVVPRVAVLDTLGALVRGSLLRMHASPGDAARYAFFETIREVATALDPPDLAEIGERTVRHYASLATGLRRGDAGLRAATHDLENFLAAQALAVTRGLGHEAAVLALGIEPVLLARGLARVAVGSFDGALGALAASSELRLRAEVLLARGLAHRELGDTARARSDFEAGLVEARRTDEPSLVALALTRVGDATDLEGDTVAARQHFDEALALLSSAPDDATRTQREAEVRLRIGHAHRREGNLQAARKAIHHAVERYGQLGDDEGLGAALYELAVVEMFAGAHAEAFARFDEGMAVARRSDVRLVLGALSTARGCLLQDLGRLDEALEHHADAARIFRAAGSRYREGSATYYLASTYLERGDARETLSLLRRARTCLSGTGSARYEALVAGCEASALAALDELESATSALAGAERAASAVRNEPALVANVAIHRLAFEARRGGATTLARAEALVAESPSDDSRFALRVLRGILDGQPKVYDALVVLAGGRGFRTPGGERVELPARSPLRRILAHLTRRRLDAPGEYVSLEDIVRAGWPNEKIRTDAALNRAYVALTALRKRGLRGVLLHGDGGYALSEAVAVRLEE